MDTRLSREALLRHLLDAERILPDEKTIYSYLLGYRLFQRPEQLLKEIESRLGGKASPEIERRFLRRNRRLTSRSKGSVCAKCQKSENPKMISKSTNNMLDRDSSLYVEILRANVMMQAPGRAIPNNLSSSDSENLSPALSTSQMSSDTLVKSTDFDDYCDINEIVFDDNRRNTAPPAALQALPSPQKLGQYSNKSRGEHVGTDFSTNSGFVSTANLGVLLERLPETNIDDVQLADGVVASGEDTIRRRKRGRRRTTVTELDTGAIATAQPTYEPLKSGDNVTTDRRSIASRDSGILSGVLEHEFDLEFHSNNNNNKGNKGSTSETAQSNPSTSSTTAPSGPNRNSNVSSNQQPNDEDSGFTSQASPNVAETLEQLAKDIEAQICDHLCNEHVVPNDAHARQRHLLHVLLVWARDFPSDFKKNETLGTLKRLISSIEKDCQELKEHCTQVLETLARSTAARNAQKCETVDPESADSLKREEDFRETKEAMIAMVTGMSDVGDAHKMAEQLCLIEMDLLSHLGAEEFLRMFKSDGDEESKTNLGACVRWFNHLSHLVATSVCLCRKPKHRRHVISLFARAAARCYELSNFNSAMAILTGLSLGAVARLKRTWSKIDAEEIEGLQNVFDPSNNFHRYRSMFNSRWAAMRSQQETEEVRSPPIPVTNRYSTSSQHSVSSRLSVASVTSQHRDSGIECENDSAPSSKSPATSSSTSSSPKRKFTFDDVTSRTGIEDGVLVPFLTLMVKDVYFLNHSTPTIEQDGTINFEKLRHLGEILHPLETWKNNPCVYKKNQKIQDFLLHSPVLKDSELYNLSYKREPPKNKFEKSQLKMIKTELETSKRGNVVRRMISRRKTM